MKTSPIIEENVMSTASQPIFISNTSDKATIDYIADVFQQAKRVDCAMAFLSYGGWELLEPILNDWFQQDAGRQLR